jgi:hypothetical protein
MSVPHSGLHYAAQASRGYVNEINRVAINAAEYDKAGKWGLDGWIRVIHELIDLQIRTFAGLLQGGVSGPWWRDAADSLPPLDPVQVPDARPYPRTIAFSTLVRLGRPDIKVLPGSLRFERILPPNAQQFEITLLDDRFIGANYKATVTLTNALNGAPDRTFEVTVGL